MNASKTPYLILISNFLADEAFVAELGKLTGAKVVHCRTPELGLAALAVASDVLAVFVGISGQSSFLEFQETIFKYKRIPVGNLEPNAMHFIVDNTYEELPALLQSPFFGSLLYRRGLGGRMAQESARHYARLIGNSAGEGALSLREFLDAPAPVQKIALNSSRTVSVISDEVRKIALMFDASNRVAAKASLAAEEILANAIFNAPVNDTGERIRKHLPRRAAFQLDGQSKLDFEIGADKHVLGFIVTDYFGTLNKYQLTKAFAGSDLSKRDGRGAKLDTPIGLAGVFNSGINLFLRCQHEEYTQVLAFLPRAGDVRTLKTSFRCLGTAFRS